MGPFVDATNPRVKDGDMDETPKQLFERQFTERLQDFLVESPGSTVLLATSINDVISDHTVFPQCELEPEFSRDPVSSTVTRQQCLLLTTCCTAHPPASKPLPLFCQRDFIRSHERRYVVSSSQGGIL